MAELILNRYKAMEEAGRGGFGTVIVAWDTRMRRKVAIKQIALDSARVNKDEEAAKSTKLIDEIDYQKTHVLKKEEKGKSVDAAGEHWEENIPGLAEARTAAMLTDANIVTVHDFEIEGNNAYIIMEYVEGLTLTEFLASFSDDMTLDMLTCVFSGVAHALEVAHAENVLHLDIKPDNVLIDSKGKVKVTDFGLATLADEFGYGTTNAGTIGYMPPEQMRRQALDVRTDMWALASLTYEMLCGQNAFEAHDVQASLKKALDSKLVVPSSCWEDIPEDIDNAIFMALSPDPNDRFDSVKEFRKEMMEHLSNPRAGQKQLAAIIKDQDPDEPEEAPEISNKSRVLEGLTNNIGQTILGRAFSAVAAIPLILTACLNMSFLGGTSPNIAGFIVMFVLFAAAIAWPSVGLCASVCALCVLLVFTGNFIVGGVLALLAILWCVYSFKLQVGHANSAASYSLFGSFGFAQAAPFITGLFCNIKDAVINTAFGFVICLVLAGLGSHSLVGWEVFANFNFAENTHYGEVQEAVLLLLTRPATYIWLVSWVATSVVVSAGFKFKQRSLHVAGVIAAIVIMIVGVCVANYFASGMSSWQPQGWEILPTIAAGAVATVIAIFLPNRLDQD